MARWVTDDELATRVKDRLALVEFEAGSQWTSTIVPDANERAYGDIVGALALRGFTPSQIAGWDRRREFQISQGLFWALTDGMAVGKDGEPLKIAPLDRREELKEVVVTIGGLRQVPGEGAAAAESPAQGAIASGRLKSNDDIFRERCPRRTGYYSGYWGWY